MDGQWHRVPVDGDERGKKSGSYRGFADGVPNGQAMNFRLGHEPLKWVATGNDLSPEAMETFRKEAETRKERARIARDREREAVAAKAREIWNRSNGYDVSHPYLDAKGVGKHDLKRDDDGHLLVPLRDERGVMWNLQRISPEGEKRFLKGGRKAGLHHTVGEIDDSRPVFVSEGYATAATIHEATGHPVVVAFDAGNLKPVAEGLRAKHPDSPIVIAADDDHKRDRNVGREAAIEAALAVDGVAIHPRFTETERAEGLTDFNDKGRRAGIEAVRAVVRDQLTARNRAAVEERSRNRGTAPKMSLGA